MSIYQPDITSETRANRIRAAFTAALLLTLAALFVVLCAVPSEAATRKRQPRFIEPTSVSVASTTCTDMGDGSWMVNVTFTVTGGRYLNLGAPWDASQSIRERDYDNVRSGQARTVEANKRFLYHPGLNEDGSVTAATEPFLYQHAVAPITSPRYYVTSRSVRVLARTIKATFTCA